MTHSSTHKRSIITISIAVAVVVAGIGVAIVTGSRPSGPGTPRLTTWVEVEVARTPPPRVAAAVAYDTAAEELVLFGGERIASPIESNAGNTRTSLDDTWVFKDSSWHKEQNAPHPPAPGPGLTGAMAYDRRTRQTVLVVPVAGGEQAQTWAWNGSTWAQLSLDTPAWHGAQALMAGDPSNGGLALCIPGRGTWMFEEHHWRLVNPNAPAITAMAFSSGGGLLGGSSSSGTMWEFLDDRWSRINYPAGKESRSVAPQLSSNWVTAGTSQAVSALGEFTGVGEPLGSLLLVWAGTQWSFHALHHNPAPDNPQNMSIAFDTTDNTLMAFGGDEGVTVGGNYIEGGSQLWLLREVR